MKQRRFRLSGGMLTGMVVLGLLLAGPVDGAVRPAQGQVPSSSITSRGSLARYIVTLRGLAPAAVVRGGSRAANNPAAAAAARNTEQARVSRVDRSISSVAGRYGITPGTRYHYALQGFAASLSDGQVSALRADPQVLSVSAVRPVYPAGGETVPDGVTRVGADPATAPALLSNVNVAVLDTGIRSVPSDPELNVSPTGIDCSKDARTGKTGHKAWADVDAAEGHGTHVSGTIGAKDTGSGIVGVAPGVRLFAVRIFSEQGGGVAGDTETVACGVDWVASTRMADPPPGSRPIDVANMSIQGPRSNGDDASCPAPAAGGDPEHVAICGASALGVTFVVAAGNSSRNADNTVPAAYDSVITVSALSDYDGKPGALDVGHGCSGDPDNSFASYSNYGAAVDLIAPGTCILSLSTTSGHTHTMSGTSMATPHVTGAAARYVALLLAGTLTRDDINAQMIRDGLRATANLDWTTASDPDGSPDRLIDVAALEASAQSVNAWAFPALVKSGAPDNPGDTVDSTISVELQRVGLYTGDVTIAADAGAATGIEFTQPPAALSGLGAASVSTTLQVHVKPAAADGDYPITIRATWGTSPTHETDATVTLRVDRHPPTIGTFSATLLDNVQLGNAQPVKLSWSGNDPGGTVVRYEIQRQISSSGWTSFSVSPANGTSSIRLVALKADYAFRVRAVDAVGNVSDWKVLNVRVGQRDSGNASIAYSSGNSWTTRQNHHASGGSFRLSRTPGAFAALGFNGRGVAWVASTGPGRGTAKVSIDGIVVATLDLGAAEPTFERVVWASGVLSPGHHTVLIKVVSGRVDLDAILLLK